MSASSVAQAGQLAAEERMLDRCRIERPIGPTKTDAQGKVTRETALVYEGKCELQNNGIYPSLPLAGGHQYTLGVSTLKLPLSSSDAMAVLANDVATITESTLLANVGRVLRLRTSDPKTFQTALRVNVEEIEG